jgi:hypothetical protein
MLNSKSRNGKELNELKISELIEEYRKVNSEDKRLIANALELNVLDMSKPVIHEKIKECSEYGSEIANEFIKRFM